MKKLLDFSVSKGVSQHLNRVIRENRLYTFCFSVFTSFSCEDRLESQLAYFF